jgi:chromate reductase, NAD(P)H dehydrogenase (quinone)
MWKCLIILCFAFSTSLNAQTKVLAFAGSTRADSANKKLIVEAANSAHRMGADITVIDLKDYPIPFYDGDLEAKEGMPSTARQLRKMMIQSDVIIIASPEYNASLSPVLKNAIDWASRGEAGGSSREAFKGKKFAIMSASPGSSGGARGLVHLRTILEDIGGTVIPLQVVVPGAFNAFDELGHLKSEKTKMEIQKILQAAIH